MVNHPPHYTSGKVECLDAIEAALGRDGFIGYCKGQVLKYCWRAGLKNPELTRQDYEKARFYLDELIRVHQ